MTKFALTDADRHSITWARLKAHLEAELADCRTRNDGPMGLEDTLTLRGRIHCLKDLLSLGDERLPIDS